MTGFLCTLTLMSLVASTYLSTACFCIVRRMTKATPWSIAIAVIAIAALGAYAFIESVAAVYFWLIEHYSPLSFHISPTIALLTLLAAIVLDNVPRLRV